MTSLTDSTDYINTTEYKKLETKLTELKSILEDCTDKTVASRRLRYAEVDIEVEREAGRIGPDELYIPVHTIDTNIRREQSAYIQYLVQSPRAVILQDIDDPTMDMAQLERDLTAKIRYNGWQLPMFANVDNFQANGYGFVEIIQDQNNPGHVGLEQVQSSDFGFVADTREIQACEMVGRTYHYTKTKLLSLCGSPDAPKDTDWDKDQVDKVVASDSQASKAEPLESSDSKDKSLYRIQKVMFRVDGVVHVAWACVDVADDWLRKPMPCYIGRRELLPENPLQKLIRMAKGVKVPPSKEVYETNYPYFLYQYLITENDTINHLKGRIFLDQDFQEGVSSLLSSTVTQARRAAGMYFSKDVEDPNDDVLMDKNVMVKNGCIINKKVQAFKIDAPDPGIFSAIQLLVSGNQQETSQTNFAESNNQRDSRKTAAAIKESRAQRQELTTVQVVLFSEALRSTYQTMAEVIKSRVLAGLIPIGNPTILQLYQRKWLVKPSGDVDVIEKNNLIQAMQNSWAVVKDSAAGTLFLCDLLEKMFPDNAAKYVQLIMQQQQQAQSQQAQMQQQMVQFAMQLGQGIVMLSKHPDYFSDIGRIHAYPVVEQAAMQVQNVAKQMQGQQQPQPKQ
jgi:hypothetical protein